MKKWLFIPLVLATFLSLSMPSGAEQAFIEPVKMRVTCYVPTGNPTKSGMMPKEGFCAARSDWIGKVAVVYDMDMNLVGYFEINDTGSHARIKSGKSIDIFRDNMERAREWVRTYGDYMYVQIIDAEG